MIDNKIIGISSQEKVPKFFIKISSNFNKPGADSFAYHLNALLNSLLKSSDF
jgi:hypothetical protein